MWLERHDDTSAGETLTRGYDCGRYFCGVVRVVVDHGYAALGADNLKPPADAAERRECSGRVVEVCVQGCRHTHRHCRISEIVDTGNVQLQRDLTTVGKLQSGSGHFGLLPDIGEANVRLHRHTDPPNGYVDSLCNANRTGVIGTYERSFSVPGEFHESVLQRRNSSVTLEVLRFHVVHHRNGGTQRQEGAVVLIGLDHEQPVASHPGIATPRVHPSPYDPRGVTTGRGENFGGHRGCGRLPVRACDPYRQSVADEKAQCFRPLENRDVGRDGCRQYGVPGIYG